MEILVIFIVILNGVYTYDRLGLVYPIGEKTVPLITNITTVNFKISAEKNHIFNGHKGILNKIRVLTKDQLFNGDDLVLKTFKNRLENHLDKTDYLIKKYYSLFYNLNSRKTDEEIHTDLSLSKIVPGLELDTSLAIIGQILAKIETTPEPIVKESTTTDPPISGADALDLELMNLDRELGLDKRSIDSDGDKEEERDKTKLTGLENISVINLTIMLIQSIDNYCEELNRLISYLREIQNNRFSPTTLEHFRLLLNLTEADTDILHATSRNYRSSDTDVSFTLQFTIQHSKENLVEYKNVPIFGYQLNATYFSNDLVSDLFTLECKAGVCYKDTNTSCLNKLMEGSLYEIVEECQFSRNNADFILVQDGLIIMNKDNEQITELLKEHNLELTVYPSLIKFTGCYTLINNGVKIQGCFNEPRQIVPSLYGSMQITQYLDPDFWHLIYKHFMDLPKSIAIVAVVLGTFGCIWGNFCLYHYFCKCLRNKVYTRVPNARVNTMAMEVRGRNTQGRRGQRND